VRVESGVGGENERLKTIQGHVKTRTFSTQTAEKIRHPREFQSCMGSLRCRVEGFATHPRAEGCATRPEHIHLLISEPNVGTPSTVMQVLKRRVSRAMHRRKRRTSSKQKSLWDEAPVRKHQPFWQRRFYDFNVWSAKKRNEKMNYMHFNPVKRGLVAHPKEWLWSSYGFYSRTGTSLCAPNPEWEARTKG
jgi:REP element-mobilizing transposase RayT